MVIAAVTKPKLPMDYAADARNMVSNGKPRMAPTDPLAADHYQMLPPPRRLHTDMKPIDYVGLYILVIASCTIATNWLYRIYF